MPSYVTASWVVIAKLTVCQHLAAHTVSRSYIGTTLPDGARGLGKNRHKLPSQLSKTSTPYLILRGTSDA